MSNKPTFSQAVSEHRPLQVIGVLNAYSALLAEQAGAHALYISGAGVANASCGIPDLGLTTLEDVVTDTRRITRATTLPVLVDADTGWDDSGKSAAALEKAGAAACHLEDQVADKRCGHRPNKQLVSPQEMADRVATAAQSTSENFTVMARTDAAAVEGIDAAIDRAKAYVEAGADMIFAEALTELDHFRTFTAEIDVPVLANMTEFGKTPYYTASEFGNAGAALVLYPLSAYRAMSKAALNVFETILRDGSQESVLETMQTREELYSTLDYLTAEQELDRRLNS